jgi:hypothetical protein
MRPRYFFTGTGGASSLTMTATAFHPPAYPATKKSTILKLIKILSGVFQQEVVWSNQWTVTNSDGAEHLMGGAPYGQRRIAHFDFQLDP